VICRKMDYFVYVSKTAIVVDVEGKQSKIIESVEPVERAISLIVEKACSRAGEENG